MSATELKSIYTIDTCRGCQYMRGVRNYGAYTCTEHPAFGWNIEPAETYCTDWKRRKPTGDSAK